MNNEVVQAYLLQITSTYQVLWHEYTVLNTTYWC